MSAKPDRRKRVRHRDSNEERRRRLERLKNTGHAEDVIAASLLFTVARENQKHCSNDTMALLRHGLKKREEIKKPRC
jgi:hypothetical protein